MHGVGIDRSVICRRTGTEKACADERLCFMSLWRRLFLAAICQIRDLLSQSEKHSQWGRQVEIGHGEVRNQIW
jgi:hypothetical protein